MVKLIFISLEDVISVTVRHHQNSDVNLDHLPRDDNSSINSKIEECVLKIVDMGNSIRNQAFRTDEISN